MSQDSARRNRLIVLLSCIGSLVLVNLLARDHFVRIDLTRGDQFTLSAASVATMESLEDPVQVTAYFSSDLPAQFVAHERYVRDLLEEFHSASGGMLGFEFIDPHAEESAEDREVRKEVRRDIFGRPVREQTSVERELEQLGIQPVEIRVIEADAQQTRRGYLGIVIRYREETEVIPVVQSTSGIEYDLTSMIRRLVRTKIPVVGVPQIHGEANAQEELTRMGQLLARNYELRPISGERLDSIDDDVDALLIIGNQQPYDPQEQELLDQFLMQGKSAAFLLDLVSVDLQQFTPTPVEHGFGPMLASYGVDIGDQLVADIECASLSVAERRGYMMVQTPVKYPFIPQLRFPDEDSPLTRGLAETLLPFAAPLVLREVDGVEWTALASSSEDSWLEAPSPQALSPRRDWGAAPIEATGPYDLVAVGQGSLPSHFAGGSAEGGESTEDGLLSRSLEEVRVVVAGSSHIARDAFLGPGNAALIQNLVDWMLLDPAMLEMRTRAMAQVPIDPDLSDAARNGVKYGNLVGLPLLIAAYGVARRLRRLRRERRRAQLRGA
jgi:gliding-associated putative ABC transporter substrate-binding component GldG